MLLKIYPYVVAIFYASIVNTVASVPKKSSVGEITSISTNVVIFDKEILQLKVNWNDTMSKDTRYNIIVSAFNATECPDFPCSAYGIAKQTKGILIPEHPMTYVENMECNYMPGCNYTLKVETSNAAISKTQSFSIPYCVEHICSCQHKAILPPVMANINITSNRTIDIIWQIDKQQLQSFNANTIATTNELGLSSIYMQLNKLTNPSLSWGGKSLRIAENFYPIQNISQALGSKNVLKGVIRILMNEDLDPKTVLSLRLHVLDTLRCAGPEKIVKIEVPKPHLPYKALINNDIELRIGLIIVTTLFVLVIAAALAILIWRRQKAKGNIHVNRDEHFFPPLAGVIEMEDNINYVDKYVEDAQLKGLADVFEIPHYAIRLGPEIGEGAFGRVFKATANNIRRMRGTTIVAGKQLKKNPTADEVSEFLSEIEMLKSVGTHHNIVSFLGCCTIRAPYLMIMEFVGRGDLLTYLRTVRQETSTFKQRNANCDCDTTETYLQKQENKQKPPIVPVSYIELKVSEESLYNDAEEERQPKPSFAETTYTIIDGDDPYGVGHPEPFQYVLSHKELHNFALQIANGMRFLEEQEITHRDLAARNVLISENKTLKISDFGLSRHGVYTNTKTRKLPLRWLSIEAIRDNLYSNKSDVWAYGVVLWEIGTLGASPYPTVSNSELIPMLLSGERLEKPEICTEEVYKIMLECWLEDPDERPTFEQLYRLLSPKTAYVDINSLSDDYVFPPIQEKI